MADRYAVLGGSPATWSTSNTGMWSATSGGATGASVPVAGDNVYFDANTGTGTITLNYSPTIQSWDMTGYNGTFASTGSITITCTGNLIMSATATYNNNGSLSLRFSAGLGSRDVSLTNFRLYGSGTVTIDSGLTFGTLSIVNSDVASGFYSINLGGNITVNGALTINGSGFSNAFRFRSNSFGTSRTVAMGASSSYSVQNVFLEYITFSGTGVPLAAGAGCGDIGYNSGVTFPAPVTYYWIGNAGSFATQSNFSLTSGGAAANTRILPQDYVIFDDNSFSAAGQAVSLNYNYLPDLDFTALSGSKIPTLALTATNGQNNLFCRSVKLKSGMATTGSATAWTMIGGRNCTFSQNGATLTSAISRLEFRNRDGFTCTLGSDLTADTAIGGAGSNDGGFDSAGYAITVTGYQCSGTATRSIDLENSAITITGSGANAWNFGTTTGLTLNMTGTTLNFTDTSSAAKTFSTGVNATTYNIVNVSGGGTGPFAIGANNKSFVQLNITGPKTVTFAPSTTYTITTPTITSSRSQPVTFLSSTPGTQYTLSVASGTVGSRFMSIFDCIGTGGATFVARESYGNNTTGWTIVPPRINQAMATSSFSLNFPNNASFQVVSASNSGVSANGSWSLCSWINVLGLTSTRQDIFGVNFTPTNSAISVAATGHYVLNDPVGVISTTMRVPIGRMVPVVTTWDSVNARGCMYVDGYLIYTRTGTATAFTDGVIVTGRFAFSASQPALANVGRRRIFARALTAAEVMAWSRNNVEPANTNLRVQYDLLTGSGTTDVDSSGNGNNGTITSATWQTDRVYTARTAVSGRVPVSGRVDATNRVQL